MNLYLSEEKYRDKVYGCWLGKNAGGTLGEPLEKRFGQKEMFNVDWYPELPEEGLPNDDLEIQLIWLQALQEKGPGLTARDLVEYWLDCICYNFDEYGLHKTNLKKGLMPPVSGWYNNWFKNCMGSPIRSEIWACVAPGAPEIAARYAFEDSICDHAGGESVYGEIFNAVVESAAFVVEDKFDLIEIGLNAIPEDSLTYQAVNKTVDLYKEGVDWKKARNIILEEFYNPIAQFSPVNLAFQTIGWLYGKDFGDAICKAVNCGWDTDCTGATLGAILGIIHGADNLPDKWMEPLGTEISTNVRTGGIRNLEAPTDIEELTEEVCNMGEKVLSYWNAGINIIGDNIEENIVEKVNPQVFTSGFDFEKHLDYKASTLEFDLNTIKVDLEYKTTPAVVGKDSTPFSLTIYNPHPESLSLQMDIELPDNWTLKTEAPAVFELGADSQIKLNYEVTADENNIKMRNEGLIKIKVDNRPAVFSIPLVFPGGFKWMVSPVYTDEELEEDCGINENKIFQVKPEEGKTVWRTDNDLKLEKLFKNKSGAIYLVHDIKSEKEREVIMGVPNNNRMKLWLNGELVKETEKEVSLAPNEGGDGSNYVQTKIKRGWNQVMIKIKKDEEPVSAHFLVSKIDKAHPINNGAALLEVKRSNFKWDLN